MADFLSKYSLALFTLAGTILGALASFLTASIMARKETRLKLREKILDRRIQAHEKVVEFAHTMRAMIPLGGFDKQGEISRSPAVLVSKKEFDEWFNYFYLTLNTTSIWLGTKLIHELNLFQDYLVNLNEFLSEAPSANYQTVGQVIRLDFIHFSTSIEKLAFDFFVNDLEKIQVNRLPSWHKYPINETKNRLQETDLFKRKNELLELIKST